MRRKKPVDSDVRGIGVIVTRGLKTDHVPDDHGATSTTGGDVERITAGLGAWKPKMNDGPAYPDERREFGPSDLDYELPDELIAQFPLEARDAARLLVLTRRSGELHDASIGNLAELLRPGDLLVMNDTKVIPARFTAQRQTGGKVGGLFLEEERTGQWRVMLESSGRLRIDEGLEITSGSASGERLTLTENRGQGQWSVRVAPTEAAVDLLERIGVTPLPPYIRRVRADPAIDSRDRARYQTVFASNPGAIAAPTAGLHLTHELLARVRENGVETAFVTLHVGVGTFAPIRATRLDQHVMHEEWFQLSDQTAAAIQQCRRRAGRVVAVGTTTARTLESAVDESSANRTVRPRTGRTDLFVYPPYEFGVVDLLLTNFHLPRSTLLAMVMALGGVDNIRRTYRHAVRAGYRFYSYGDAMLIR